ncbi:hypothetical protein D3C78_1424160 [compost metagenome]
MSDQIRTIGAGAQCAQTAVAMAYHRSRTKTGIENGDQVCGEGFGAVQGAGAALAHAGEVHREYPVAIDEVGSDEVPPVAIGPVAVSEEQHGLARVAGVPAAIVQAYIRALDEVRYAQCGDGAQQPLRWIDVFRGAWLVCQFIRYWRVVQLRRHRGELRFPYLAGGALGQLREEDDAAGPFVGRD